MQHITITPFGRPVTAALMAARAQAVRPAEGRSVPKWSALRDLTTARLAFGITDRDLTVLQALLSFLPEDEIADTGAIVFPSNAKLSERAHGMAESSLRRHLAALVGAGILLRHDSPNGKRYAARGASGQVTRAFGFDLAPLARRMEEIAARAAEARAEAEALKRQREELVLTIRDASALLAWGIETVPALWDDVSDALALLKRSLRRKLGAEDLSTLMGMAREILATIHARLPMETAEMDGTDAPDERHIQNSHRVLSESETALKQEKSTPIRKEPEVVQSLHPTEGEVPPLPLVLESCPEIRDYAPDGIASWHQMIGTAATVSGYMGISPDAWAEACRIMGPSQAAVAVACLLQRGDTIAKPGGYLRSLSAKAAAGGFRVGPMLMAQMRSEARRVSKRAA